MAETDFITCEYPESASTINMHGWDTVYAVRFPVINKALKKHFDPSGDLADAMAISCETRDLSIDGKFAAWQLTAGGSGNHIFIDMPFASGTVQLKETGAVLQLPGLVARVEVILGFHSVSDRTSDAGTPADLKIVVGSKPVTETDAQGLSGSTREEVACNTATGVGEDTEDDSDNSDVTVHKIIGLDKAGVAKSDLRRTEMFLGDAIAQWLEDNDQIFDFVFLSVDIAGKESVWDFQWIKPTSIGYAVADLNGKSADYSIFAVMAMTEGRSSKDATAEVSSSVIPHNEGVNAAFVISPHRFIEKFMRPNIASMFMGGATEDDFNISYRDLRVSNKSTVSLPLKLDQHYYDQLRSTETGKITTGNFSITIDNRLVTTRFESLTFPYGRDGIVNVEMMMHHANQIGIDQRGRFAMQTSGEILRHISVAPDPVKAAAESWKSFAINLGVTVGMMCMPAAFKGAGKLYGGAKSLFSGASSASKALGATESALAKTGGLVSKDAILIGETELTEVAENGLGKTLQNGDAAAMTGEFMATGEVLNIEAAVAETAVEVESVAGKAGDEAVTGVAVAEIPKKFDMTFLAMMTGQLVGGFYGQGSNLATIGAYKQDATKIPSLVNFGDSCIKHVTWPGQSEAVLHCAGLNGAFVMGFNAQGKVA